MHPPRSWLDDPDAWFDVPATDLELFQEIERVGWGDGLPVIAPTRERIEACLMKLKGDPDRSLGSMPISGGAVTPAKVAANTILAGAPPEAFPVVLTAMEALLQEEFNLTAVTSTTHPVAPLVIVHGPIADELGMNWGPGAFGPGNVANATIGRAVRLCMMNIGGALPGAGDRATQGQPSKYSYCVAENVVDSPWEPYTTTLGFEPEQSAVTVYAGENPHNVNDHENGDAKSLLHTVGLVLANGGSNNVYFNDGEIFVIFGPEHAASIAESGFGREDVQWWLFEHARLPLRVLQRGNMWSMRLWPPWMLAVDDPEQLLPMVRTPDRIRILVVGGVGKHSAVVPGFGSTRAVTKAIVQEV